MTGIHKHIKFSKGCMGRPPAFESPNDMWERACEYFDWCDENSLPETKAFGYQGEVTYGKVPHMRAMTQAGLCAFLNIGTSTFSDYKQKENFSAVILAIEQVMFEQKFTGAAAGMLKENIISRELGLADRQETKVALSDDFDSLIGDLSEDD